MKANLPIIPQATSALVALLCLAAPAGEAYGLRPGSEATGIIAPAASSPGLEKEHPSSPDKSKKVAPTAPCFVLDTVYVTLCPGESHTVGGHVYAQTGAYLDTLVALPCDTVLLTVLTVLPGVDVQSNDIHICAGESSQLQAYGGEEYTWTPASGLSAVNVPNPVATPLQTTTYTVSGFFETENLIVNGDFELGNTMFSSNYTYSHNQVGPQAMYDITSNALNAHPNASPCTDHTSGTGNFMMVNGAGIPNTTVWQQTVAVQPQSDYLFSAWVTNWSSIQFNLSDLQFSVNGQLLGNVFQPLPQQCIWKKVDEIWNSGTVSSAVIRLVNQNTTVYGNDFGLDDIRFSRVCASTDTVQVTVHQPVVLNINPVICQGEAFTVGNTQYDQTGSYANTLQTTAHGCDSTVLTNLAVLPVFQTTQMPVICQGDSLAVGASVYINSGLYIDVLQAMNGCDSTVTTQLTVNPVHQTRQSLVVCEGDSVSIGGNTYTTSGNYVDVLVSANGCDSTVTTTLTVLPSTWVPQAFDLCEGESVAVGNQVYSHPGVFVDTLESHTGCDSIVTTSVSFHPLAFTHQSPSICPGDSVTVGSSVYKQQGVYQDTLHTWQGCDSTVTTNVTLLPAKALAQVFTICEGESLAVGNNSYTLSGNYLDTLQSWQGCDSIVSTALTVLPVKITLLEVSLCEGEGLSVGSNSYTQSGNYLDTLQSWQGCDSIVSTALLVSPNAENEIALVICDGEVVNIGNENYEVSGFYVDTLTSHAGCDSIVRLDLTVETLDASLATFPPSCHGEQDGGVVVTGAGGGMPPFVFAAGVNDPLTTETVFSGLGSGPHLLAMESASGCRVEIPFWLDEPPALAIDLPPYLNVELGEGIQLQPLSNFIPDSILWEPAENLSCADCPAPFALPLENTIYRVRLADGNGCFVEGQVELIVRNGHKVYLPNVFSPDGDGINDLFVPLAGPSVRQVRQFKVFDRWGGMVFEATGFLPGDAGAGWDGTFRGQAVSAGTFVWLAEVEYINGETEVLSGGITVLR